MNLWVKRTGQLFIAALFLMSCEDDSYLLGFKNQNKRFNVRHQEFTLPSAVLLIDSISSDNYITDEYRLLIGEYVDPTFGTVRAESFTQLQPSRVDSLTHDETQYASLGFDSVTIQLRLDLYTYGREGSDEESFTIHEITEDSISAFRRYYHHSTLGYDAFSLGEIVKTIDYDDIEDAQNDGDTVLIQTRLDNSIGQKIFNYMVSHPDTLFINKEFDYEVKGLAFIPSSSSIVFGINVVSSFSNVTIHYHTASTDSLSRTFYIAPFSALSFNHITTDRTGELAGLTQTYQSITTPSGNGYLQNGTPVITKIDISEFNSFIRGSQDGINDSLQHIAINKAEISMEIEPPPPGMPPPASMVFRVMKANDQFMNSKLDADSTFMSDFYAFSEYEVSLNKNFGIYYYPGNDRGNDLVELVYNSSTKKYTGYVTVFMQTFFDLKNTKDEEVQYLALIPAEPSFGKSLSRAVIKGNSVKLKIDYTAPVVQNQD